MSTEDQKLPPLEVECQNCEGQGWRRGGPRDQSYRCYTCSGQGKILTEAGKELLSFIHRNIDVGFTKQP